MSDILAEHNIALCPKTIQNIMFYHRDEEHNHASVRGARTKKPMLNEDAQRQRRVYSSWLIREYNLHYPKLIFVCYDETSKAIGGRNLRGGKQKISRPRGADANEFAIHFDQPQFNLIICAATSTDTHCDYLRPCVIWEPDQDDLKKQLEGKVAVANKKLKEKVTRKQARATVAGTAEETALREVNGNIKKQNKEALARNRAEGKKGGALRKGTKHELTPEQFFKQE